MPQRPDEACSVVWKERERQGVGGIREAGKSTRVRRASTEALVLWIKRCEFPGWRAVQCCNSAKSRWQGSAGHRGVTGKPLGCGWIKGGCRKGREGGSWG